MKVVQVGKAGGDFEVVERPIPEPERGQVRIKVEACGICHSELMVKEGYWPGLQYPRVPGHEVAGRIDAVGPGVTQWKTGQRVGVGWHGGHCFVCEPMPPWRFHRLPIGEDHRLALRWRLCRIHDRAR
jgi:D-arabinose 1-dehydrogenase-like Zn-dependent alcohol dehydrogenase